ncbi:MAG: TetR/AcrR family transcriptional regulator [Dehalococcoidia bacterium]
MAIRTDDTRERILEAAEMVFADKGYHDALVDEVGRATAMSKGGLYFHFPSKEGLFFAVMDRLADKLVSRAQKAADNENSPLARAEAALDAVLTALAKRRRLARLLIVQGYSMGNAFERKRVEIFDRFANVIRGHLDDSVAAGEIEPVDTEIAARVWLGAVNEVVIYWLYAGGPSPSRSLPTIHRLLVSGITRPAGRNG